MTPTMPTIKDNDRFSGTAAATLLGISRETLRKYVNEGRIRRHYSRKSARPYYLGRDLLILWRS